MDRAVIGCQAHEDVLFQAAVQEGDLVLAISVGIGVSRGDPFHLVPVEGLCQLSFNEIVAPFGADDDCLHDALGADHAGHRTGIHIVEAGYMVPLNEVRNLFLAFPVARVFGDLVQHIACSGRFPVLHEQVVGAVVADEGIGKGQNLPFIGGVRKAFLIARHAGIEYQFPSPSTEPRRSPSKRAPFSRTKRPFISAPFLLS